MFREIDEKQQKNRSCFITTASVVMITLFTAFEITIFCVEILGADVIALVEFCMTLLLAIFLLIATICFERKLTKSIVAF